MSGKRRAEYKKGAKKTFKIYIISVVLGALGSIVMLLLCSLIMWLLKLPPETGETFGMVSFGAGCLIAGMISAKIIHRAGMLCGIKAALLLLLPVMAVSIVTALFSTTSTNLIELLLGRAINAIICGAVGGVIGVNDN
ncbi:MAG: TIGR04086 family membrane protein [Oscillospiraceae bacterium]|nr:TIGR04086 family membrane protein [Oscillospiraceae bacterium]